MSVIIKRCSVGERITCGRETLLCAGATDDGRMLTVRSWKDAPDTSSCQLGDFHTFAPTVRQLRKDQGDMHDAYAEHGVNELFGKHEGKSIIIVANGPSITRYVDVIRELREKHGHIVIGVNAAMKYGFHNCMDYYMVLCWLTQKWWWTGYDTSKIPCVTSFGSTVDVIRDFPNRYYYDEAFIDIIAEKPESRKKYGCLDGGVSVTYSAYHLAYKMGASRIILAGVDCAYTDNMDHPDDPLTWEKAKRRQVYPVCDINGKAVLTDKTLMMQHDLMKAQTVFVEEDGIPVINISGGGILDIGGRMTAHEYLDTVRKQEAEGGTFMVKQKEVSHGGVPAGVK